MRDDPSQAGAGRAHEDPSSLIHQCELAIRGSTDGFWSWDIAAGTVWFATHFKELLGFGPDELEPSFEVWEQLLHPQDRDATLAALTAHLDQEVPYDVEYRLRMKDGSYRWFRDRGATQRDGQGRPLRMAGTILDVTDRKETEDRLREAERRLRSITESSLDYIMLLDRDACILYINRTVPDLTVEGVLGTSVFDYMPPELHAPVRACFDHVLETGEPGHYDSTYEDDDGHVSFFESNVCPVFKEGRVAALAVTARDTTRRIRAEEALRQSEERYRAIVDTTAEWIWEIDLTGRHTFSNPAIETMLGYSVAELRELDTFELIHPNDREMVQRRFARAIDTKEGWDGLVIRWRHKSGEYRVLESNARPILTQDGELIGYRGSDRDVTERQSMQARLAHAQKLEALGQLAGGIAHDFNNLLLAVLGRSELLARTVGADARTHVEEIQRAGNRAAELTRQLLAFSRKQVLEREVLDLNRIVDDACGILHRLIEARIEIDVSLADTELPVYGDAAQLEQVVINLVTNARDAMPASGVVELRTAVVDVAEALARELGLSETGRFARLCVTDEGHGMDSATLGRAFEPFFTTKPVGKGTGLGLASAYGTVKQSGGEMRVRSELGRGTSVEVYLPLSEETLAPPACPLASRAGFERILLVEDDQMVATTLAQGLTQSGYEVALASSGPEALSLTRESAQDWDLLVTDIVMPQMDGLELAERMRADRPGLRVLLISGYANESAARIAAPPETICLQKPFTPAKLTQTIRSMLDR